MKLLSYVAYSENVYFSMSSIHVLPAVHSKYNLNNNFGVGLEEMC